MHLFFDVEMSCVCYCECKKRKKRLTLNIAILILSTACVALDAVSIAVNDSIGSRGRIAFEVILIVANSIVSAIQSFQLKLEQHHKHEIDSNNDSNEANEANEMVKTHNKQVIIDTLAKSLSKTDLRESVT